MRTNEYTHALNASANCCMIKHSNHISQHIFCTAFFTHDFPLVIASRMRSLIHTNAPNKRSHFLSVCCPFSCPSISLKLQSTLFPHSIWSCESVSELSQKISLWLSSLYMRVSVRACMWVYSLHYNIHLYTDLIAIYPPTHQMQNKQINRTNKQKSRACGASAATVPFNLIHCHIMNPQYTKLLLLFCLIGNEISATTTINTHVLYMQITFTWRSQRQRENHVSVEIILATTISYSLTVTMV